MPSKAATALLGVGAFSLALAALVPAVVTPSLLKAPATIDVVTHSRSEAQLLDTVTGKLEPVTVDLTRTLTTHQVDGEFAGDDDTAVYQELINLATVDAGGDIRTLDENGSYTGLNAMTGIIAFDRKTGAGRPGFEGETYETTAQTVKFPFDTQKKTYEYYDQTSGRAWPVEYQGTTTVQGLEVYEFFGTVPETELGRYGVLEGTTQIYSNTGRSVFVEPVTGSIVSSTTSPQTSIRFPDGSVQEGLLVENLVPTDETIADLVADAKDSKTAALMLQRAPWVLGGLGVLLLVGGGLLGRRRTVGDTDAEGDPARPDVSGLLPPARTEPAVDRKHVRH